MESQTVEHKKTFGKEVIISLVAFANAEGGKVIVSEKQIVGGSILSDGRY